jgi:hypothetical protein
MNGFNSSDFAKLTVCDLAYAAESTIANLAADSVLVANVAGLFIDKVASCEGWSCLRLSHFYIGFHAAKS